jgi:hypothetical protein
VEAVEFGDARLARDEPGNRGMIRKELTCAKMTSSVI